MNLRKLKDFYQDSEVHFPRSFPSFLLEYHSQAFLVDLKQEPPEQSKFSINTAIWKRIW